MLEKSAQINTDNEKKVIAKVYPNPSSGDFVVKLTDVTEAAETEVILTDMLGRKRGHYTVYRGSDMVLIPAAELEKGLYICTIQIHGVTVETLRIEKL